MAGNQANDGVAHLKVPVIVQSRQPKIGTEDIDAGLPLLPSNCVVRQPSQGIDARQPRGCMFMAKLFCNSGESIVEELDLFPTLGGFCCALTTVDHDEANERSGSP